MESLNYTLRINALKKTSCKCGLLVELERTQLFTRLVCKSELKISRHRKVPESTTDYVSIKTKIQYSSKFNFQINSCQRTHCLLFHILSRFQMAILFFSFKVLTLHYMRRPGLPAGAGNKRGVGWGLLQVPHSGMQRVCAQLLWFWDCF